MLTLQDIIAATVPGSLDPGVAVAASQAGATGVLNLEWLSTPEAGRRALDRLACRGGPRVGVQLSAARLALSRAVAEALPATMDLAIVSPGAPDEVRALAACLRPRVRRLLIECTSIEHAALGVDLGADGLIAKGHEAGGIVGEETAFVLVQRLLGRVSLPVWAHGGIGLHSAAACVAAGCAGVVLDWQLALARESKLPSAIRAALERFEGHEAVCVRGDGPVTCRLYRRPGLAALEALEATHAAEAAGSDRPTDDAGRRWREALAARVGVRESSLWLMGQDAVFAAPLARRSPRVADILTGMSESAEAHVSAARRLRPLDRGAALAESHGTEFPILQGPMTRVSDSPRFAGAVADAGALPFLALALLRKGQVRALMEATRARLGDRPWGVGILGFVPYDLREEQLDVVEEVCPRFALIAGGRPDQAARLEKRGIATYLHVPAPGLLSLFLDDGARRFVFEGRECGGHVGPRSSFVLWDCSIDVLLDAVDRGVPADELHVTFAGGIHDARSAAMVSAMAAPLAERGVKIGVLIGTAYLFTEEAVRTDAIVEGFQQEAIQCSRTVLLETSPGHSIRCVETPFVRTFDDVKRRLRAEGKSPDDIRAALEDLNLGRLRIASKGVVRGPATDAGTGMHGLVAVAPDRQHADGMYMIGQVAALRDRVCRIAELHENVSVGGSRFLDERPVAEVRVESGAKPVPTVAPASRDIAIVGLGCLLPGGQHADGFWANVLGKVDAIREIPKERFDYSLYYDPDRNARDRIYSKWGGFIDDVPFDPMRYGIPPSALPSIDSLQLLALVAVDQALHHAGYATRDFPRDRTSVILGLSGGLGDLGCDYSVRANLPAVMGHLPPELRDRLPEWTEDSFAGLLLNVAAGRIANRFDLGGVNYTVDAACASSLSALAAAVRELQVGSSDVVIVGGVDTVQSPFGYLCFSKAQALSPRGRCSTFDQSADGIVISEGVVMFVLRRLEDAKREGDRIYAVVKAVAGSSDGRGKGLMAPRVGGQVRALERAYAQAGVSPATVGLIEAHGTGTVLGDATEVESLTQVFQTAGAAAGSCALGSVKSMIGHTKSAAGVAGLLKVVLALHHKVLPPTLHVTQPNAKLGDPASPFFVNVDPVPWLQPADGSPRRAGVSSFGFGGTNFHAVVEEYTDGIDDPADLTGSDQWPSELVIWTAASAEDLAKRLAAFEIRLGELGEAETPALRDLAAAVWRADGRQAAPAAVRLALVASDVDDLRTKVREARTALGENRLELSDERGIYLSGAAPAGKLAFLFPGQGSQHPHMLRELVLQFGELRESLDAADSALASRLPRRLSSYIFPPPAFDAEARSAAMAAITDTVVAQPALGAVEIGLFRLLASLGVEPDMLAGHSYGEYVALSAAGVFPQAALFAVSEARGRAIKDSVADAPGAMAAISASADAVVEALGDTPDVWLANVNAPQQSVIAGRQEALEAAVRMLEARRMAARPLPVACAFHTPLMNGARERLAAALGELPWAAPRAPVFSNATGQPYPAEPEAGRALLSEHLTRPVRFLDEVRAMHDAGARIFLEVGPKRVLTGLARQSLAGREALLLTIDAAGRDGVTSLLHVLAALSVSGVGIDLDRLFRGRPVQPVDLVARRGARPTRIPGWLVNGRRARARNAPRQVTPQPVLPAALPVTTTGHGAGNGNGAGHGNGNGVGDRSARPAQAALAAPPLSEGVPVNRPSTDQSLGQMPGVDQGDATSRAGGAAEAQPAIVTETPVAPDAHTAIVLQFQSLMGQFLQTQEAVMAGYFQAVTGGDGARPAAPASRALPAWSGGPVAVRANAPMPASAAPLPGPAAPAVEPRVPAPSNGDRRDAPQAAADGGAFASSPAPAAPPAPAPAVEPAPGDPVSRLLQIVSERTGYPEDMLDLDSNIEADLGIDSIKRVEILSTFQRQCSPDERSRLQAAMEKVTSLKTLRDTARMLGEILGPAGGEAAAR